MRNLFTLECACSWLHKCCPSMCCLCVELYVSEPGALAAMFALLRASGAKLCPVDSYLYQLCAEVQRRELSVAHLHSWLLDPHFALVALFHGPGDGLTAAHKTLVFDSASARADMLALSWPVSHLALPAALSLACLALADEPPAPPAAGAAAAAPRSNRFLAPLLAGDALDVFSEALVNAARGCDPASPPPRFLSPHCDPNWHATALVKSLEALARLSSLDEALREDKDPSAAAAELRKRKRNEAAAPRLTRDDVGVARLDSSILLIGGTFSLGAAFSVFFQPLTRLLAQATNCTSKRSHWSGRPRFSPPRSARAPAWTSPCRFVCREETSPAAARGAGSWTSCASSSSFLTLTQLTLRRSTRGATSSRCGAPPTSCSARRCGGGRRRGWRRCCEATRHCRNPRGRSRSPLLRRCPARVRVRRAAGCGGAARGGRAGRRRGGAAARTAARHGGCVVVDAAAVEPAAAVRVGAA